MNVTGDGLVDWEEFCSYMLMQYLEKDSLKQKMLPFQDPPKVRSMFCKVSPLHHLLHYHHHQRQPTWLCQRSELSACEVVCAELMLALGLQYI